MPGLYSHTTRATGLTLTADIYNTDHQNHITNADAANLGGHSTNATQMQATADPGEVGSENLASSVADELERLRFIIKEMKGATQWYPSTGTKHQIVPITQFVWTGLTGIGFLPDGFTSTISATWYVPADYASGDITFTWYWHPGATGTAVLAYSTNRWRSAVALATIHSSVSNNIAFTANTGTATTLTVAAANFQAADLVRQQWTRFGANGSDTLAGDLQIYGVVVSYTGYLCRDN